MERADRVVVSIYVNPGQFAQGEDLSSYPRDLEGDLAKLRPLGVAAVFNPEDLYVRASSPSRETGAVSASRQGDTDENPAHRNGGATSSGAGGARDMVGGGGDGHETWIQVERLQRPLEGRDRPIFFRGVATIVAKLFNIVEPDYAFFGRKDYQQWRILERMARDLDFGVEVVGLPLLREPDGLAMSSRNVRLSPEERQKALSISRGLFAAAERVSAGETSAASLTTDVRIAIESAGGKVDYVELVNGSSLLAEESVSSSSVLVVAARFGSVRLIDNVEFRSNK
ncbi:pantoate-beta-alanine ligase [Klebsormidium nitens]|uniref:Pantoate--beta-alanine ligase n=1 Tax=Klebsormidium nitens TaxID=105231 RepID=A0A1Y1I9G7_KLENI|nr:pantoate-beta-alanine ligase [Klebsormidium nitens]|eukprot:GAQ87614.1 pantoate-beta-alanine ligase [Klebsormidium nitens]